MRQRFTFVAALLCAMLPGVGLAQALAQSGTLHAHLAYSAPAMTHARQRPTGRHTPPAVLWLTPIASEPDPAIAAWKPRGGYRLLQKDRTFVPHLIVLPPGSKVTFPNMDPFFHNVFSLFNGKRFDLGLYEAGSSRSVTFSRQGASYIFCNIHPEMSAVVLALASPYFAIADEQNAFAIAGLPVGEYDLQVWIEGATDAQVVPLRRRISIKAGTQDIGALAVGSTPVPSSHSNLFGGTYSIGSDTPYGP